MSNRIYRFRQVVKALNLSRQKVDTLTKTGIFPANKVLTKNGAVRRLYDIDECKRYYDLLQRMFDRGVRKSLAYKGIRETQVINNETGDCWITGKRRSSAVKTIKLQVKQVPSTQDTSTEVAVVQEEESKKTSSIIIGILFVTAVVLFVCALLFLN